MFDSTPIKKLHLAVPTSFYMEMQNKGLLNAEIDNLVISLLKKHMEELE